MKRGGKWFIAIVIIAIIAVVLTIVFINLFKEKDTKQLAESVNEVVETGYLSEDNSQYKTINEYLGQLETVLSTASEKAEVKNCKDAYVAYTVVGDFFDRQIVFSQFTETYKNQRKKIEKNLKKSQDIAVSLEKFILDNKELVSGSDYWQANTWANCKEDMKNLIVYTTNAFNLLSDVYQASVTSKLINNGLSDVVFDAMKTKSSTMIEKINESGDYGIDFYNFINLYLSKNGEKLILNFNYNEIAQKKVADIKENGVESVYYNDLLQGRIEG